MGGARRAMGAAGLAVGIALLAPALGWSQTPDPATAPAPPASPDPEPANANPPPEREASFLRFVYEAEGIFFFPQLLLSVILVSVIVAAALELRRVHFVPIAFVNQVVELVAAKRYKEAFEMSKREPSFVGTMLSAGMENISRGLPAAQEAMDDVGVERGMQYEQRMSWLALIANVATMIGLLGTVWGMVSAFMVIARSDVAPKPSELANGVSQALITTVWGLLQAIPAVFFHTLFKNRMARFVLESELVCKRILTPISLSLKKN